jgi:tRNA (mo5U34)-methyltransferase
MNDSTAGVTLREEAAKYYWYHSTDLGGGVTIEGDYDLRGLLPKYGFPDRMDGMTVLDVGRGSGFFAFEFERRGAAVVATDIASFFDWDFVGGENEKTSRRQAVTNLEAFSVREITGAFDFARSVKKSQVISKLINVYDLSPDVFGGDKFDLVFAGSILSHVRDPILALERLYSVTKHSCVVAAPVFDIPAVQDYPMMSLVGTMDSDRRSWWVLNSRCLTEMLRCAGFAQVKIHSHFTLVNKRVPSLRIDHVVAHAEVK